MANFPFTNRRPVYINQISQPQDDVQPHVDVLQLRVFPNQQRLTENGDPDLAFGNGIPWDGLFVGYDPADKLGVLGKIDQRAEHTE